MYPTFRTVLMQLEDTQLEEHSFTEQLDAEESAEFTKQLNEFEKIYQIKGRKNGD